MIDTFKVLAVVSARGGSTGVKQKNIRALAGKPLICHSLDLVRQSKYVDDYVVSTDSDEIARVVAKGLAETEAFFGDVPENILDLARRVYS